MRSRSVVVLVSGALLLLTSAPALAQYRFELTRASDDGILTGPRIVMRASTQVEGNWNIRLSQGHGPAANHKASFGWVSGQEESFKFTYDRVNQTFRFDVSGTVVMATQQNPNGFARFEDTDTVFVRCLATHPGTTARIRVNDLFAYATILTPVNELVVASSSNGKPAILRVAGAPFENGFRVGGTIRLDFPDTPGVQLTKDLLTCEVIAAESGTGDRDGDGVLDGQDVCPNAYDPLQLDADGDGTGDACDVCPASPDDGTDLDGDGVPEACDNCPDGCALSALLPELSCWNGTQSDRETSVGPDGQPGIAGVDDDGNGVVDDPSELCPPDPLDLLGRRVPAPDSDDRCGDGVGDRCDNCADRFNGFDDPGNQTDADGDGVGDACEPSGVIQQELVETPLTGPGSVAAIADGSRSFQLSVDCGPRNAAAATIGVRVPASATLVEFGDCAQPSTADPTRTGSCAGAVLLGASVDPAASYTLGRDIATPAGIAPDLFYVHVEGSRPVEGLPRDVLCEAEEPPQPIGVLRLTGIGANEQPTITTQGLEILDLALLEDAETGAVPATDTTVTNVAGDQKAVLRVSPAFDDVTGTQAAQLTLESNFLIHNLCVGLQASTDIGSTDAVFGGCDAPVTLTRPSGAVTFLRCPDGPPADPNLGPGVKLSATSGLPQTYVLPADSAGEAISGLLPNTTYVVLRGGFFRVPPTKTSLNNPATSSLLGVHRFVGAPQPPPVPRFEGCAELLSFVGDAGIPPVAVVPSNSTDPITQVNFTLEGGFDPLADTDGDLICDNCDNCLNAFNPGQLDQGQPALTITEATLADGVGDDCQCGDGQTQTASEPGSVLIADSEGESDLEECRRALVGDAAVDPSAAERCSVSGGPSLDSADLLALALALDADVEEVGPDDIRQVCQPAVQAPVLPQ
jgi:hypothetical protein